MTTRLINITLILFGLSVHANSQIIKEKVERIYDHDNSLIEQTEEHYNRNGKLVKSIRRDYTRYQSITISNYLYNENGQLIKEIFSGFRSYSDSLNIIYWTDTSVISITEIIYNSLGQMKFRKEYNFQCNLDTCNITEFFYNGSLLVKKFCANDCSMKQLNYNYPIYYEYDKNDSLIMEKAYGPTDTTKIWYINSYNFDLFPDKYIFERYYRKKDSLQLEYRVVSRTEYSNNGKITRRHFLENTPSSEEFIYNKKGLLKMQISISNGRIIRKEVYVYNKRNNIVRIEKYELKNNNSNKLKMNRFHTFEYKYY